MECKLKKAHYKSTSTYHVMYHSRPHATQCVKINMVSYIILYRVGAQIKLATVKTVSGRICIFEI